jgi:hypothetical protein
MKVGTKSILLGCHQFIIHPIFVYAAWIKLYKHLPNWQESICIFIHDWGYWQKPNMDGQEGEDHPRWASDWAYYHLDHQHRDLYYYGRYSDLCMFHSRFQARRFAMNVSKLCLPDKIGVSFMPAWLWVNLAKFSGEIKEYMAQDKYEINQGVIPEPSGKDFRSPYDFFRAYKKKAKEWEQTRDLTIRYGNTT